MKRVSLPKKENILYTAVDCALTAAAVAAPIYSGFRGGLGLSMFGQPEYLYFIICALLVFLFLRDIIGASGSCKKAGKLLAGGKYLPAVLQNRGAYAAMFLVSFLFLVVIRPKMGALCVLLSTVTLYFVFDVRLILSLFEPGIYEKGVYFFGAFYPWENVRSYNIRQASGEVKFNVKNEQKKLLFSGDIVIKLDDTRRAESLLKNRVKAREA